MKKYFLLIGLTCFITGCLTDDELLENKVIVSQIPVNLGDINSEFDDYNSDYDPGYSYSLIFSSNRKSQGKDFDFVVKGLYFLEDSKSKNLTAEIFDYGPQYDLDIALRNINSPKNELGPYFNGSNGETLFMYSTENESGYDIKFMNMTGWYYGQWENFDSIPKTIPKINKLGDDLYPTFTNDKKNLIFCSNKDGKGFDIYNASFDSQITCELLVKGDIKNINKIEELSSNADDKCPFIGANDIMVFTSNREGGYGGYDLWYSFYKNGIWSNPKNFGSKINSNRDEYRPIIFKALGRNIMIFSSNRSGGKGGFDLYAVEYVAL
jgi:hypothetical protein